MATTVAELTVKVAADLASFRAGVSQLNKDLLDFDKGAKSTVKKVNTYFSTIKPRINTYNANADLRSFQFYADKTAKNIQKSLTIVPTINTKGLNPKVVNYSSGNGSMFNTPNVIKTALTYFGVREIQEYADAWTSAQNKINAAAEISGRAARSLSEVNKIATDTRTDLSGTVDLYARLLRSTKDVAKSEQEIAQATSTVNKAFKTGGADVQEQRAGLIQLSQALGSGMLQGDELRSIRENAPVLAQAIADYFGTTISGLKKLGSEGQLTSDKVFKAILAAQGKIDAAFSTTNQTIAESFTMVGNAMTEYIGKTNSAHSIGARLVEGLKSLADNFDVVADTTIKLAAVIAGALIGRSIVGMIAKLGLAKAEVFKFISALRTAQTVSAVTSAFGGVAAAAGPIGALIGTVLVGSLIAFGAASADASAEADAYRAGLEKIKNQAKQTASGIDEVTEAEKRQQIAQAQKNVEYDQKKENEARKTIVITLDDRIAALSEAEENDRAFQAATGYKTQLGYSYADIQKLKDLRDQFVANKLSASDFIAELRKIGTLTPILGGIIHQLESLGVVLGNNEKVTEAARQSQNEMAGEAFNSHMLNLQTAYANQYAKQDFFKTQFDIASNSKFEQLVDKELKRLKEVLQTMANPPKVSEEELRTQAERNVTASLQSKSTDSAIEKYVNNVIGAESGGRSNAKNPLSSATGVGQFIESTWLSLFKEMFPEEAKTKTKQQILDLRNDIETSKVLIAQYAKENAEALQKAGVTVDEAALQLAHFLGPAGAIKVLQAAPGTPIKGLLPDKVIAANQSILGGDATVDTVRGYAEKRAGMNTPNAQAFGAREEFGFTVEGWKQAVENRKEMLKTQQQLNPLENDYGKTVAEEQAAEEALNYAREHGLEVSKEVHNINELLHGDLSQMSPAAREQAQAMRDYATSMGEVEAAGNKLSSTQDRMKSDFESLRTDSRDVLQGFVQDLLDGKSAAEALANALNKIANKLLDKAFDLIFNSTSNGGSGIFGSLLHVLGFASGGYTGDGGKYEPAGVVHKGEYVLNQSATRKLGVGNLDRLNRGMGYANGGYVTGISNASVGNAGISGGGAKSQLQIHLITDNAAIAGIADARIKHATPAIVTTSVRVNQDATKQNFGQYVANYNTRTG